MAALRAVPARVWSAVVALVVLASLGLTVVLGAGIHVWRSTVAVGPEPVVPVISPAPGSGVVTVPGHLHRRPPSGPGTPQTPPVRPGVVTPVPPAGPAVQPGAGQPGAGQPASGQPAGAGSPGRPVGPPGRPAGHPSTDESDGGPAAHPALRPGHRLRTLIRGVVHLQGAGVRAQAARSVRVRLHALRVIKKHHLDRHRDLRSLLARRFVAERNAALRRDRRPGQGHGHAFGRGQSSDHAFGRGHGQGHGHAFGRGHSSGRCH